MAEFNWEQAKTLAESEYTKLITSDGVARELIEHPQFKDSFIQRYIELCQLATRGESIAVNFTPMDVSLYLDANNPSATNTVYTGKQDKVSYRFSIENHHDRQYLSESMKGVTALRFPSRNKSEHSYQREMRFYYGKEEVARVWCIKDASGPLELNSEPYYYEQFMPQLSIGYALNTEYPPNALQGSPNCSFQAMARSIGSNICKSRIVHVKNDTPTYMMTEYGTVNPGTPNSLDNIGGGPVKYDELNKTWTYPSGYVTLNQWIADFEIVNEGPGMHK